jgi:DNA-binding transcriptional MerR regulator
MEDRVKTLPIREVSERLGIPKHTLRFWERELEGLITPVRTGGGQRRYTFEDVLTIHQIKSLKQQGFKLEDIKKKLNNHLDFTLKDANGQNNIDQLANKIADLVRLAVRSFFEGKILE